MLIITPTNIGQYIGLSEFFCFCFFGWFMLVVQRCKALKWVNTPSTRVLMSLFPFLLLCLYRKAEHIRVVSSQMRFPFLIKENKGWSVSSFFLLLFWFPQPLFTPKVVLILHCSCAGIAVTWNIWQSVKIEEGC